MLDERADLLVVEGLLLEGALCQCGLTLAVVPGVEFVAYPGVFFRDVGAAKQIVQLPHHTHASALAVLRLFAQPVGAFGWHDLTPLGAALVFC